MNRDEIVERLPFYANGTLSEEERAEVENSLQNDAALREELALLNSLRASMQAERVDSPGDVGLSRLMAEIDRTTPANQPGPPRFWRIAAGILLAIALAQGALLLAPGGTDTPYQLAGDAEPEITVAFRPDVTEAELRSALLSAGLVIVDGPSALGLYGLATEETTTLQQAREALIASGVIESIQ